MSSASSQSMSDPMTDPMATEYVDGKRYLWLLGLVVPMFPLIGGLLAWATGSEWGWWFAPIALYGLIPLIDHLVGGDPHNPPESAVKALSEDRYYRYCVYAFLPLQYIMLIGGAYLFGSGMLGWVGLIGLTLSLGIVNAVGFNAAHELGHQNDKFEHWLAKIALAPAMYGHFFVEHNRGHHVRVATPEDPASARYGESYWRFLPRTVIGGVRSAWEIEAARLKRRGKPALHWSNHNLQAWGISIVLFAVLTAAFGWFALPFLIAQAVYAASLFEVINYVEHYGLRREKTESGRYERCQPKHSWNSNHMVTNLLLYQLQRHSDHHANPTRSYQALRHFEDVPQLPNGYAGMVPLAYITPLWRKVMDPKVKAQYDGDLSKANVDPRLDNRVVAEQVPA